MASENLKKIGERGKKFVNWTNFFLVSAATYFSFCVYHDYKYQNEIKKAEKVYSIAVGEDKLFSCEEKRQFLDEMGLDNKTQDCKKDVTLNVGQAGKFFVTIREEYAPVKKYRHEDYYAIPEKTIDDYIARHAKE